MDVISYIKDLLFPPECAFCREKMRPGEGPLCRACYEKYESAKVARCPRCRRPNNRCICRPGGASREISAYLSAFPYSEASPGGRLILRIKDRKDSKTVALLARDMANSLRAGAVLSEDALVTFAPRSASAGREKGVDQAYELALQLSRIVGLPFERTLLHKGAGAQKGMSADERRAHAAKSFSLLSDAPDLSGRQVILVDDIVTSGATFSSCARLLKERGAGQVICLSAGKTRQKNASERSAEK